jgi:hypothetical protein
MHRIWIASTHVVSSLLPSAMKMKSMAVVGAVEVPTTLAV